MKTEWEETLRPTKEKVTRRRKDDIFSMQECKKIVQDRDNCRDITRMAKIFEDLQICQRKRRIRIQCELPYFWKMRATPHFDTMFVKNYTIFTPLRTHASM